MADRVDDLLERIRGQWDKDDPEVLLFDNDDRSVVAGVDGSLRTIGRGLVFARETSEEGVRVACDKHGEPRVVRLSTQEHRFDKADFEDIAELRGGGRCGE